MNNLVDMAYALRILWSYIKCIGYKFNLKYLGLPITYLIIIMLIIPSSNVVINEITYKELSSYTIAPSKEEKRVAILEKYGLSEQEFKVLCAIVLSEAESNSYEDAYAVINTIYNRTHSKNWVRSMNNRYGKDKGLSLYYQAIAPNQFVVYEHGTYKKHLNNTSSVGYEAIIDFLYTENVIHDYLSFRAHNIKVKNSVAFSEKGNNYFNKILDENRI